MGTFLSIMSPLCVLYSSYLVFSKRPDLAEVTLILAIWLILAGGVKISVGRP